MQNFARAIHAPSLEITRDRTEKLKLARVRICGQDPMPKNLFLDSRSAEFRWMDMYGTYDEKCNSHAIVFFFFF